MPNTLSPIIKIINLDNLETYKELSDNAYEQKTATLTYAEYLALPDSEKNNGTTYYVPDAPDPRGDLGSMIFALTGTLTAGQTSITFTDSRLTNDSIIDFFYPGVGDVTFETFTQNSSTSFTLTYEARQTDLVIKVLVYNL